MHFEIPPKYWAPVRPLTAALRDRVLGLLRSQGRNGYPEAQRLLGWKHKAFHMPDLLMARELDLTAGQLRYMLVREDVRAKRKAERAAEKDAQNVVMKRHVSKALRCSIELPNGWRIVTDTPDPFPLAQALSDFKYSTGAADRPASTDNMIRLERMQSGLFQASASSNRDAAELEIIRLRLDLPLTALQLYEMHKQPIADVPWRSRPSEGMTVDGMPGVVYYYMLDTGEEIAERPVFFTVYLSDGLEGWSISCSCKYGEMYFKTFKRYKPVFRRIISSFARIRAI